MKRLERYVVKDGKELRMGYTTGSCAAAAARAAVELLLTGKRAVAVSLATPSGVGLLLEVERSELGDGVARAAVRKDAGDDPDATDGILIHAAVSRIPAGWELEGGEGVGRVTMPGLACPVGQAAINPVPRRMIVEELRRAAQRCGYGGGLRVVISAPEGEEIAAGTHNPRLGIVGGISILGTSGLVEPMSQKALVDTIQAELDSRAAQGRTAVLITPGNYGREFAASRWGLDLEQGIKCSNYIGETVDYLAYRGFRAALLAGHAGKLVKLAAGIMNTHSSVADGRMEILAAHGGICGLAAPQLQRILDCVTVDAADQLLEEWGAAQAVWAGVAQRVETHLRRRAGNVEIAFAAFSKRGVVMESENLKQVLEMVN